MKATLIAFGLAVALLPGRAEARESFSPSASPGGPAPLGLDEVLRAVDDSFPLLRAAEADRSAAEGDLRSARGGFDTRIVAEGDLRPAGFYESYSGGAKLEQPTRLWGTRFFAGYRVGRGDFASYDGGRQTNGSGEVSGGFELPLLRGGAIDEPRARLQQAELDLGRLDPEIELQRIGFQRDATIAYWRWVASGLSVGVGERLLRVAEARQGQIEGRVRLGLLPRIDLADNERLIVDRRIRLRGDERDAEQAAIALSLFLRNDEGNPQIAARERLPEGFPTEDEPNQRQLLLDVERAASDHPLLRALDYEVDAIRLDYEVARNDALPAVDLRIEGSRDFGAATPGISSEGSISPDPRGETEVRALIRFELPVLRREARGRAQAARARLERLENERRFARDRIEAEIRRSMAGLEAAFEQTLAARQNLELAWQLEAAEERKLMLGDSNLINVNIRELQTAEGNRALIEAQAAYFKALADYRAAVATGS